MKGKNVIVLKINLDKIYTIKKKHLKFTRVLGTCSFIYIIRYNATVNTDINYSSRDLQCILISDLRALNQVQCGPTA